MNNLSDLIEENNRTLQKNTTRLLSSSSSSLSSNLNHRSWDFWDLSLLFLLVFGLIGNLLSISVMNRIRMRFTNAPLFVTALALSDCLFLSTKFLSSVVKLHRVSVYWTCILIHHVLPQTTLFVSVWLVILTTLERAVAVLAPLQVAILFSPARCKLFILLICVFFFVLSNATTPCLVYANELPSLCRIRGDQTGACYRFYAYVFPWIKATLGAWIPSVIGIALNALIVRGLFAASRLRQNIAMEPIKK